MKNIFTYFTNNKDFTLLAFDAITCFEGDDVDALDAFLNRHKEDYRFGFVSYTSHNHPSNKKDKIGFPKIGFFVPRYVVEIDKKGTLTYLKGNKNGYSSRKIDGFLNHSKGESRNQVQLESQLTQSEYLTQINALQADMNREKVGVVVFCQEFYAEKQEINPKTTYFQLNQKSKSPFSCFVQWNEKYVLSASPERFIKKEGTKLITQPIKGTAKRGKTQEEDEAFKNRLLSSEKEIEENTLVVEGIKNDLMQVAKKETVDVESFSQIHSFETVHQLISTISAEIEPETSFGTILKTVFPMGSMVGFPKEKALKLLDKYEAFNRGLYSGTIGYIQPNGNFDFNVVIRSILYDDENKTIICPVGGGITLQSSPEDEYNECLIKLNVLQDTLNNV
ncbi:MAG TPA: chorismate-binding protein [Brumimicrobium sp.]|nr:chorismate-binding protein [Brumimicrobium sp.]